MPVLFAATEYTLGAPTVPAPKALAVKLRLFNAPARYVTVMLFVPLGGAL